MSTMPPFYKLDDAGRVLPRDATTWSQSYDPATGLVWANESLFGESHEQCMALAAAYSIGVASFRAPTSAELMTLIRHEHAAPAADPEFFNNAPHDDWHWSSSPVVSWPEGAWSVHFNGGGVYGHPRSASGWVRPVRVARPRQYLAIGDAIEVDGTTPG